MSALHYKVLNTKGKEVGKLDLDPEVFGGDVNESLVHDVVRWQLNCRRAGTHSTLNKSKMIGGGRKPWAQKGTGRARAGSNDSPLWVGGAVIFGPQPRSYASRITKRTRRQALISVLTHKVATGAFIVIDELKVPKGKTKNFVEIQKSLGVQDGGSVFVMSEAKDEVRRSTSNVQKVLTLGADGVNVYDLLRHKHLVCTKDGVEALVKRLKCEATE